jgi:hypothetical protein
MEKNLQNGVNAEEQADMLSFELLGFENAKKYKGSPKNLSLFLEQIADKSYLETAYRRPLLQLKKALKGDELINLKNDLLKKQEAVRVVKEVKIPAKERRLKDLAEELNIDVQKKNLRPKPAKHSITMYLTGVVFTFLLFNFFTTVQFELHYGDGFLPGNFLLSVETLAHATATGFSVLFLPLLVIAVSIAVLLWKRNSGLVLGIAKGMFLGILVALLNVYYATGLLEKINIQNQYLGVPQVVWHESLEYLLTFVLGTLIWGVWYASLYFVFSNSQKRRTLRSDKNVLITEKERELEGCEASIHLLKYRELVELESAIDKLNKKISQIEQDLKQASANEELIKICFDKFCKGWNNYLKTESNLDILEQSNAIIHESRSKLFKQPSINDKSKLT